MWIANNDDLTVIEPINQKESSPTTADAKIQESVTSEIAIIRNSSYFTTVDGTTETSLTSLNESERGIFIIKSFQTKKFTAHRTINSQIKEILISYALTAKSHPTFTQTTIEVTNPPFSKSETWSTVNSNEFARTSLFSTQLTTENILSH